MPTMPTMPTESADARIARLELELLAAKEDKAGKELEDSVGEFLALVPDYQILEDGEAPPALEELEAAARFCREAWTRFETWRAAHRLKTTATATARPYLALPPAPTPTLSASGRRPPGTGCIQPSGAGFRWQLFRDGRVLKGRAWPTRQEAEAELACVIADPSFVPSPKDGHHLAATVAYRCSRCRSSDHRAPACPIAKSDTSSFSTSTEEAKEEVSAESVGPPTGTPAPPAGSAPSAKRPPGHGATYRTGTGWRWSIRRAGMAALQGKTFRTEADAVADLDRVVAERISGAAPPDLVSMTPAAPVAPAVKPNTCAVCGESGHNARRHRLDSKVTPAPPAEPPTPTPPRIAPALAAMTAEAKRDLLKFPRMSIREDIDGDENPSAVARSRARDHRRIEEAIHIPVADPLEESDAVADEPEDISDGWTPPDATGRQTCIPCDGEGVDSRPGEGAGRCCLNCEGEGYRWPDSESSIRPATSSSA
jgi:hypothetical protein